MVIAVHLGKEVNNKFKLALSLLDGVGLLSEEVKKVVLKLQ
jgi:hypothetical protein